MEDYKRIWKKPRKAKKARKANNPTLNETFILYICIFIFLFCVVVTTTLFIL